MRADRLVATLLVMQARGLVTAAELADELEISVATARRDLEALSAAGIPVYPQRGRGGGWALLGGARTDLSGLSFPEMQALFLLVGPAAAVSTDAKSALRKLVRALPESFRQQAEAASAAVVVDPARWGHRPPFRPTFSRPLRNAVVARTTVLVAYRDGAAPRARAMGPRRQGRHLVPDRGDAARAPHLPGRPDDGGERRPGRHSRPPHDFDLAEAWAEILADLEGNRSGTMAEVTMPAGLLRPLRDVLGARHVEELGDAGDGRVRLRVSSNTPGMLARQLAGWAPEIDVLGPPEVLTALAAIGADLAERYATRE